MTPSGNDRTETPVEVDGRRLTLVNLEKVMYPRTGTTKAEVLNYYAQVAPVLLPHLADRAVTRIRWPHGTGDGSFFEKNVPAGTPSWVRTVTVPTTGSRARWGGSGSGDPEATEIRFPVVEDLATLTWLVNLAALELHVHQWTVTRAGRPRNPNRLVVDLDPGEPAGLMECSQVALWVRERLAEDGLDCVPVTSGSKGLHLYAGLDQRRTHEEVKDYAKAVAEDLERAHPALVVSQMTKARRGGKVFLDWSQNTGSKTTISPYSLRGREEPLVAAPRTWEEVEEGAEDPLALEHLRFEQVLARMRDEGDLFLIAEDTTGR